jgi:amino acid transporter
VATVSYSGDRSPAASLGLLDATMVGIGAMIGAGIFVLTGLAAEMAGPAAILVFALNGGVTTFTALSYAELAAAIPRNGGGYAYVREVFSAPVSFVMGWTRWFTYMIAGALYALGFAPNFEEFFHLYGITLPGPTVAYALGAVVVFVTLNAVSTEASGSAETIITIIKVAILLVFVAFGLSVVNLDNFRPLFPADGGAISVLPAMGLTFIAFQGYDLIATVTEEVENPQQNIPRAILLSVLATVVVYLLVVFVALGTTGAAGIAAAGEPAIAEAALVFMPTNLPIIRTGAVLIAFGAVFSTISALNAVVIGSSRVAFAMGRERQLPARLGQLHPRFGTPFVALLGSGVVMLVASLVVPIRIVGNLASLFSLLGFVIVNVSVIRLRRQQPDLRRPFEIPYYPIPPILGIAFNLLLGAFIDLYTWALAVGWLALGGVLYMVLTRSGVSGVEPEPTEAVAGEQEPAADIAEPEPVSLPAEDADSDIRAFSDEESRQATDRQTDSTSTDEDT